MSHLVLFATTLRLALLAAERIPARQKTDQLVFIKTHSTGSSTLTNLLHRYCDKYGRKCYVPSDAGRTCNEKCLKKVVKSGKQFEIWPNHVLLVPELLNQIVPNNIKISIFRKPFDRLMSSFSHGGHRQVEETMALLRGNRHVDFCGVASMPMSHHVPVELFGRLDFVLLTEQYNLGLVMMRRFLGWRLEDIVYRRMKYHGGMTRLGESVDKFRQYLTQPASQLTVAALDFMETCIGKNETNIYNLAKAKFERQYQSLSPATQKEVDQELVLFEKTLAEVRDCCNDAGDNDHWCNTLKEDNRPWVARHTAFFMRKRRSGCISLVRES